ncbi:MAG: hypothetical protein HC927_00990 [Deltaproteobacteria bacterium]|nr:hypothetical protein [Deltaproteobacteria bacterium]
MRIALSVLLASSLPLALVGWPAPVSAAEPVETRPVETVRLVANAKAVGEDAAAVFEPELLARLRAAIEAAGFEVVESTSDATVRIRLSFYDERDLDYVLAIEVAVGDEVTSPEPAKCPQCVETDLYAAVDQQGARIVEILQSATVPTRAVIEPVIERPESPATLDREEEPPVAPLGALGGVGIGIAALGVGSTIAGTIELSRGLVRRDTSEGLELDYIDHRPVGGALFGVGIAGMSVGAALLVADLVLRARKRQRMVWVPWMGQGAAGLGLVRHF